MHLRALIWSCAEAGSEQLCRASFRQDRERLLGTIVGQYRRLSTCAVRAQALCILARVTPAARDAARRGRVARRLEGELRDERRSQWMASIGAGLGKEGPLSLLLKQIFSAALS